MILDFFSDWYFHKDSDDSDSDDKKKKKGATPPVLPWRPLYYVPWMISQWLPWQLQIIMYTRRSSDSSDFFNVELS